MKVLGRNGQLSGQGKLRDRLADVAIVMDDLGDREPLVEQIAAVLHGALPHLQAIGQDFFRFLSQDASQLRQEERHSVR